MSAYILSEVYKIRGQVPETTRCGARTKSLINNTQAAGYLRPNQRRGSTPRTPPEPPLDGGCRSSSAPVMFTAPKNVQIFRPLLDRKRVLLLIYY